MPEKEGKMKLYRKSDGEDEERKHKLRCLLSLRVSLFLSLQVSLTSVLSPTESLALHLLAEHAGHGDIDRGIER